MCTRATIYFKIYIIFLERERDKREERKKGEKELERVAGEREREREKKEGQRPPSLVKVAHSQALAQPDPGRTARGHRRLGEYRPSSGRKGEGEEEGGEGRWWW